MPQDVSSVRAAYGGGETGPSPADRAKLGSKHHVITDANGIPLTSSMTAANVHDVTEFAPLVNRLPEVVGKVGHPRRKPDALQGDLAYDSEPHRQGLREMGIEPVLLEREIDDQEGLGETRRPVERTLAWVHQNHRLRIRYERRLDIHQAFLTLACIKICASDRFGGLCQAHLTILYLVALFKCASPLIVDAVESDADLFLATKDRQGIPVGDRH